MELKEFIDDRVSLENADVFLEMQGKKLEDYKPIFLISRNDESHEYLINSALNNLAKKAIDAGCDYVVSLTLHFFIPNKSYPTGVLTGQASYMGTGLILKKRIK